MRNHSNGIHRYIALFWLQIHGLRYVCPCDCFREGKQMLYIDPAECIDCDACRIECPVEAIFPEWDVPDESKDFIQLNAEMAKKCPPIFEKKAPLKHT
jgi:ferredoxin